MKGRYYTPVLSGDLPRPRQILVVVPSETVKNSCHSKMLADFIGLDARASYSLLIVGGGFLQTSKELFNAIMKSGGREWTFSLCNESVVDALRLRIQSSTATYVLVDESLPFHLLDVAYSNDLILPIGWLKFASDGITYKVKDFANGHVVYHQKVGVPVETKNWYGHLLNFKNAIRNTWQQSRAGDAEHEIFPHWVKMHAVAMRVRIVSGQGSVVGCFRNLLSLTDKNEMSNRFQMIDLLTVIIGVVRDAAADLKLRIDFDMEKMVRGVFCLDGNMADQTWLNYRRAHVSCAIEFMLWLVQELIYGHNVYGLLDELLTDLFRLSHFIMEDRLGVLFGGGWSGRVEGPTDMGFHFYEARSLTLYQRVGDRFSAEVMGIPGLRQALENRMREIIGLGATTAHVHHDVIPQALFACQKDIFFANRKSCLLLVYKWTNHVVHEAYADKCWVCWKAFDYLGNFFKPSDNGMKNGTFSINGAIHLTVPVVYKIREEFLNRIREDERCRKDRHAITFCWKKPEVVFDDAYGGNRYWDVVETIGIGGMEEA